MSQLQDNLINLFNESNLKLFSKYNHSLAIKKRFSKIVIEKYPSPFFDKWIETYPLTKMFTMSLINKINNYNSLFETEKYTNLLYMLIETRKYNKSNVTHLENILIENKMFSHVAFLRLHIKDKLKNCLKIDNLNFFMNLKTVGINNKLLNDKILKLSLNNYNSLIDVYDLLVKKMTTLTNDEQIELVAKVNPQVFQLLLESNVVKNEDKTLQKILTHSSHIYNIDLYQHLLENYNLMPSKSDILKIFGLTLTKKPTINTKCKIGFKKTIRYRYVSPLTRFRNKFNLDNSVNNQEYTNKLIKLVTYYTNKNIKLINISGIKYYVCHLISLNCLELQLEICKNIGYKHTGYTLNSLICKIIKSDNCDLLKKFIDYSQIELEKFVNSSYLTYSIVNNCFKIAHFMVQKLKMKTSWKNVITNTTNISKLKFLAENNLPIQETVMTKLFEIGDIESIEYCIDTFNYNITSTMITQLLKNQNTNTITIFKKYYKNIKNKYPQKMLSSLLSNTITIFTLPIIKIIISEIKVKSNIMFKILKTTNLNIIKYFCETKGLNLEEVTNAELEMLLCSTFPTKKRTHVLVKNKEKQWENLFKTFNYIKQKFSKKFEEFNKNLKNKDDLFKKFLNIGVRYDNNILNHTLETFDWIPSEKILFDHICDSRYYYENKLCNVTKNLSENIVEQLFDFLKLDISDDVNFNDAIMLSKQHNINIMEYYKLTPIYVIYGIINFMWKTENYLLLVELFPQLKVNNIIYNIYITYIENDIHLLKNKKNYKYYKYVTTIKNITKIVNTIQHKDYKKLTDLKLFDEELFLNLKIIDCDFTNEDKNLIQTYWNTYSNNNMLNNNILIDEEYGFDDIYQYDEVFEYDKNLIFNNQMN